MKITKRQPLKRKIAEDSMRRYKTRVIYELGFMDHIQVLEVVSGAEIILTRDDVAQACVTYIEKKLKPLSTK